MATQHFQLQDLSCPSCIMHLEAIEDAAGITKVDANFKRQSMRVEYDAAQHTPASIQQLISELGYIAIPQPTAHNDNKGVARWTKFFRS